MRFFFFSSGYRFAQAVALFTIGVILGAVLSNLMIGYQLDKLHGEKGLLEAELAEKASKIEALEGKVSEALRWLIVQEIIIKIELPERHFADEKQVRLELEGQGKEVLKSIRGKRLQELDAEVVWEIIDGRNVEALSYHFVFEVKSLILAEKSVFHIYAHYLDPRQESEAVS